MKISSKSKSDIKRQEETRKIMSTEAEIEIHETFRKKQSIHKNT